MTATELPTIHLVRHAHLGPSCLQGVDAAGNRYCQRAKDGPWYWSNTPDGKWVDGDRVVNVVLPEGEPYKIRTNL